MRRSRPALKVFIGLIAVFTAWLPVRTAYAHDCLVRARDGKAFAGRVIEINGGYRLVRDRGPTLFFKKSQVRAVFFDRDCRGNPTPKPFPPEQPTSPPPRSPLFMPSRTAHPYKGRPIDLDIVHGDLHDILQVLAETAELNLIVAPEIQGDVTLHLKRVPWDQILEILARMYHFAYRIDGRVLFVFRPKDP